MLMFKSYNVEDCQPNVMVLRIQPDEGISLTLRSQTAGTGYVP